MCKLSCKVSSSSDERINEDFDLGFSILMQIFSRYFLSQDTFCVHLGGSGVITSFEVSKKRKRFTSVKPDLDFVYTYHINLEEISFNHKLWYRYPPRSFNLWNKQKKRKKEGVFSSFFFFFFYRKMYTLYTWIYKSIDQCDYIRGSFFPFESFIFEYDKI